MSQGKRTTFVPTVIEGSVNPAILSADEIEGIILAAKSAFKKVQNLYDKILPVFDEYGFKPPSAGVIARDLSEKIELSIQQHCPTFKKGEKQSDLSRAKKRWEVKICKNRGLTINQSAVINGENYIIVNYKNISRVSRIWILWNAQDHFFTPRKRNMNLRTVIWDDVEASAQILFEEESRPPGRRRKTKLAA